MVCELQARVDAVTDAVAGAPRPRVFFELSPDLYTAGPGSYIDDLITRAGGDNVAAGAAEMWPQLSAEAVVSADPEVILLADHEAGITAEQVAARPGWQRMSAVQQGRIVSLTVRPRGPTRAARRRWVGSDRRGAPSRSVPRIWIVKLVASPAAPGSFSGGLSARSRTVAPIIVAALSVCLAGLLALTVGKAPLSPALPDESASRPVRARHAAPVSSTAETILLQIRLPRIVLAGLVGAALAVAGATYQGVFRNPLADPYLLGVASGASLGAVLAFVLPIPRGSLSRWRRASARLCGRRSSRS